MHAAEPQMQRLQTSLIPQESISASLDCKVVMVSTPSQLQNRKSSEGKLRSFVSLPLAIKVDSLIMRHMT